MTLRLINTAKKIGAHTLMLPECGHAYGAASAASNVEPEPAKQSITMSPPVTSRSNWAKESSIV